jgi:hypothetical protein
VYRQLQNLKNLFSAHNTFMCWAWILEQTTIVYLYRINLSVFITEAESVYCAVRTESLNRTDTVSSLKGWVSHSRRDGGTFILQRHAAVGVNAKGQEDERVWADWSWKRKHYASFDTSEISQKSQMLWLSASCTVLPVPSFMM